MPDIALLTPLADMLEVTITELLSGDRIQEPKQLNVGEVEQIITGTIGLSLLEQTQQNKKRLRRGMIFLGCVLAMLLEIVLLVGLGFSFKVLFKDMFLVEFLCLLFGGWFCLFAKEVLPAYYDENKISFYSDGVFRLNLAGIHFNNNNWPHILSAARIWMQGVMVLFPLIYLWIRLVFPDAMWESSQLFITLAACLGGFIPIMIVGKRFE
jgi:hypothetical protein